MEANAVPEESKATFKATEDYADGTVRENVKTKQRHQEVAHAKIPNTRDEEEKPGYSSRHQRVSNGATKKTKPARKSMDTVPQQQIQQKEQSNESRSVTKSRHKRSTSSPVEFPTETSGSIHARKKPEAATSMHGRTSTNEMPKKVAPTTRGAHMKLGAKTRKRSSSVDVGPTRGVNDNIIVPPSPTPSEGKAVRSKVSIVKKGRVASNSSTNSRVLRKVSKASGSGESTKPGSENKGSRKTSPTGSQRKESLKAKASAEKVPVRQTSEGNTKTAHQSPATTKPKASTRIIRKVSQPDSSKATSKARSKSLLHPKPQRTASLSPKRHSQGKSRDNVSHLNLSSASLMSTSDLPSSSEPGESQFKEFGHRSAGFLSGNKRTTKAAKNDLGSQLESQQSSREGQKAGLYDSPVQRKSESSVTFSAASLSSTCHEHMLTPKRVKGGSVAMALLSKKRHGLNATTSNRVSAYAGDIANLTSTSVQPRHSLAPNILLNSTGHGQVDSSVPKPKPSRPQKKDGALTTFGNPLVPIDIVEKGLLIPKLNLMHHKDAVQVLGEIKNMKRQQLKVKLDSINTSAALPVDKLTHGLAQQEPQFELKCIQLLKTAGTSTSATLSMTGFKGGQLDDQVNQDRSLIVSPFYLRNHGNSMVRRRLVGVFDGHAEKGHLFAEHCQQRLPSLLSRKLSDAFKKAVEDIAAGRKIEDEVAITKRVLIETFLAMDESSPKEVSGGCTATVVYQQGQKVFVANTGDSRSCIAVYRRDQANRQFASLEARGAGDLGFPLDRPRQGTDPKTKLVKVVYISREDKPDLPEERSRLESFGGEIVNAEKNKSAKVKFHGVRLGKASATLSMSRSIGDSQFTPLGVIADPVVDVIDLKELLQQEKSSTKTGEEGFVDDICIFALCASDGMMIESVEDAEAVALDLAPSLFSDDGPHPLTACQNVVQKSAAVWDKRNKGKFRDDITLAMTVLRTPPST